MNASCWAAKLWIWKNGDHFLAFDSEYPTYDGGDPKTLGEPIGYALLDFDSYSRMIENAELYRNNPLLVVKRAD